MFDKLNIEANYTKLPNDIHLICKNQNQLLLLQTLIRLQGTSNNGHSTCHASLKTLSRYMLLKNKHSIIGAIKWAMENQYLDYVKGCAEKCESNEYSINMVKIIADIRHNMSTSDVGKLAAREYKQSQINAMTIRNAVKNPELAHQAELLMGNTVVSKDGEILNNSEKQVVNS